MIDCKNEISLSSHCYMRLYPQIVKVTRLRYPFDRTIFPSYRTPPRVISGSTFCGPFENELRNLFSVIYRSVGISLTHPYLLSYLNCHQEEEYCGLWGNLFTNERKECLKPSQSHFQNQWFPPYKDDYGYITKQKDNLTFNSDK